ncbi:universal stress protein [Tsukamurella spumae]|uniref:universal stress protein n=1 Tax=Tsukamurella spumae TaxID=44753 RepID=UPI0031D8BA4C
MGASGVGGFGSMLLGSVAMTLVTGSPNPVAVIRGNESRDGRVPRTGPVVLGVDAGASSEEAIAWGFDEASRRGTDLIAVHAWTAYVDVYARLYGVPPLDEIDAQIQAEEAAFAERLAGWREKYPEVAVTSLLRSGKPAKTLLEYAGDAQLVVVGSRGHGDITGVIFGSVSRSLIHQAPCPVLVARTRG